MAGTYAKRYSVIHWGFPIRVHNVWDFASTSAIARASHERTSLLDSLGNVKL